MSVIWDAVLKLYGEYGASQTHLTLIDYDAQKKLGILCTVHTSLNTVRAALASITQIRDRPAAIHILKVSGTIKALHKKMKSEVT